MKKGPNALSDDVTRMWRLCICTHTRIASDSSNDKYIPQTDSQIKMWQSPQRKWLRSILLSSAFAVVIVRADDEEEDGNEDRWTSTKG